ncbi:MAG: branched-chain amino acid ABC transporter substrate-binding protein [Deltaproteobacteria bacterium]|jgi:branched-chain amino acid transport system substrate-binding protein|nr:branched-chain amino acid ABC transporter substrate-binding protein [Deltaproteobacteria bacterium]
MKKFLCLCVALLICSAAPAFAGTVKIGLMAPLTGAFASEGADMRRVVELLTDELNKKGGINGSKVELIVQDDGSDVRTAASAASRLTTSGICAVIGTYGSSVTEATQNIYNRNKIIQVSTGSTAVRLSEKGLKYFFRTSPRDDEQGNVAVETLHKLNYKNVIILHDNSAYAVGLAEEIKGGLEKAGKIKILGYDALQPNERDYNAILTRMRSVNPEAIFFTGYYPEAAMLLRQMREMGWKVPMLGGDATNNSDLLKIGGVKVVEGFRFISPPMPDDLDTKEASDFLAAYKAKYNNAVPSSIWSVLAGDAFKVIVEAIVKTGSTDPDKLADYLHNKLANFEGLSGKISFDAKGDRVGALYRLYQFNAKGEAKSETIAK